jgi:hypothetical protein
MANTNAPFGFKPYGNVLRSNWYPVAHDYGTALFIGDVIQCAATPTGLVCGKFDGDTRMSVELSTAGAAGLVLGAALAFMHGGTGDVISYLPATQHGDGVVAGYVLVADHPDQLYIVQEDGDTTPIAAANIGQNISAIYTHTGNTGNGQSKAEIDSNTVATTNTFAFRLVKSYPGDTVASAYCRWIVIVNPNASFYASATAV